MADDGLEETLHVGGHDIAPPREERPRPHRALEREAGAHGGADLDLLELARRPDELDGPALQERVDVDLLDRCDELGEIVDRDDRPQPLERVPVQLAVEDPELLLEVG